MDYAIEPTPPGMDDYLRLRVAAGLSPKTREGAAIGLPNSWYGVTVRHAGRVVGMGRVIGDGGTAFQIVDIAVEPEHQGMGLGKRIMSAQMERLHNHAPAGAYVSLIADVPANRLYSQFGFDETAPRSVGMARRVV